MDDSFIAIDADNNNSPYNIECYIKYDGNQEKEKLILSSNLTFFIPTNKYNHSYSIKIDVDGVGMYVGMHIKNNQGKIY